MKPYEVHPYANVRTDRAKNNNIVNSSCPLALSFEAKVWHCAILITMPICIR